MKTTTPLTIALLSLSALAACNQADEAGAQETNAFQSDQAAAQLPDAIAFAGQEKV